MPEREPEQEPNLPPLGRLALYIPAWLFVALFVGGIAGVAAGAAVAVAVEGFGNFYIEMVMLRYAGVVITVTDAFLVALTLGFLWFIDRAGRRSVGLEWNRKSLPQLALGAAIGALFVTLVLGSYAALGWLRFDARDPNWLGWALTTLIVCPMIGFSEELAFRGYLMKNLDELGGRVLAILGSTVLFWMVHLGGANVHEPLGAATMLMTGLMFALARYGPGGLWLPIGMHAAYDWAAITAIDHEGTPLPGLLKETLLVEEWIVGAGGNAGAADLVCITLLTLLIYLFIYRRSERILKPR